MSRNSIREVRDDSKAVPGLRDFIEEYINGWRGVRKSRGSVRT